MHLQQHGLKITFGIEGNEHVFKLKRRASEVVADFKAEDVFVARDALRDAAPDDAETVDRYAERLLRMVG